MKTNLRLPLFVLIIFLGFISVKTEFEGHEIGLLSEFNYFPLCTFLVFSILIFFLERHYYNQHKKLSQFFITFFAVLFCTTIFYKIYQRESIEKAKTLIKISNLPHASSTITFEFKENNNFSLHEYSRIGGTIYYGKYDKVNDTIIIKESNYNENEKKLPQFGIIKNDTMFWNKFDTMIVDKK